MVTVPRVLTQACPMKFTAGKRVEVGDVCGYVLPSSAPAEMLPLLVSFFASTLENTATSSPPSDGVLLPFHVGLSLPV